MLVLLDTNAYLRLAKRIRPVLGVAFGHVGYVITIHQSVEDEVHRNSRLRFLYPWFDAEEFSKERLSKQIRLTSDEKASMQAAQSVLHGWVLSDPSKYILGGRSPPGLVDCLILALVQVKRGMVVTDDIGMHTLAEEFNIGIWHGYELLNKLRSAKLVDGPLIREIYAALEVNGDLPKAWHEAKHSTFKKIFGHKKNL